jgi:hypothetical protein
MDGDERDEAATEQDFNQNVLVSSGPVMSYRYLYRYLYVLFVSVKNRQTIVRHFEKYDTSVIRAQ